MNYNGPNPELDWDLIRKDRIIEAEDTGYFKGHKTYIAQGNYKPKKKELKWVKASRQAMWGKL